jgi:hypothetical protein
MREARDDRPVRVGVAADDERRVLRLAATPIGLVGGMKDSFARTTHEKAVQWARADIGQLLELGTREGADEGRREDEGAPQQGRKRGVIGFVTVIADVSNHDGERREGRREELRGRRLVAKPYGRSPRDIAAELGLDRLSRRAVEGEEVKRVCGDKALLDDRERARGEHDLALGVELAEACRSLGEEIGAEADEPAVADSLSTDGALGCGPDAVGEDEGERERDLLGDEDVVALGGACASITVDDDAR